MPNRDKYAQGEFSWADLATSDEKAALKYYSGLFGWKDRPEPMGPGEFYHMQEIKGRAIAAINKQRPEEAGMGIPPHWNCYISVTDVDAVAKKVPAAGGKVVMGPFDVFDSGRMIVASDPTGAFVSFWQAKNHIGAQVKDENGALTWGELMTPDAAKATKFLSSVLGVATDKMPGPMDYTVAKVGDKMVFGIMQYPKEMAGMPANWMPYFQVADIEASTKKAVSLGGKAVMGPSPTGMGKFSTLRDPQGAHFSIFQPTRR